MTSGNKARKARSCMPKSDMDQIRAIFACFFNFIKEAGKYAGYFQAALTLRESEGLS
jgi:hypothetical protein